MVPHSGHEEYGPRAAYVVLSDDGAVVMNDNYNGLDAEARENVQSFLKQQERERTGNTATATNVSTNRTGTATHY